MTATDTHPPQFMRHGRVPDAPEDLRARMGANKGMPALQKLREAAWQAFSKTGLPWSGAEEYTFLSAPEMRELLTLPAGSSESRFETEGNDEVIELFDLSAESAPATLTKAWTEIMAGERDAAMALAVAFAARPTVMRLKRGRRLGRPYSLTYRAEEAPRTDTALFLDMEAGSAARIALKSEVPGGGFLNTGLTFRLGENAELDLLQDNLFSGTKALKLRFLLGRNARLRFLSTSTGGKFQRLALEAELLEGGAELDVRGAAVVGGANRCHRHVIVRHHAPDCVSRQLFKAVVLGSGRSGVDGTVIVERGAQRTDARQLLQHLMLSREGRADGKPRLLIHADDVKCSHGATVGKTDAEQQFYLRSRGLDAKSANRLLTHAFLAEALDASTLGEFREDARARLLASLEAG